MRSEISKILIENNLDPYDFDMDELYNIGRKNIFNNIEYYYDKDYSCKSVIKSLFSDGILKYIKSKTQKSKIESIVEERTKDILFESKKISDKHKEITQSIEYAKSLQKAVLPSLSKIYKALPNSFLFYKPKDIIGGDFYWFTTYNQYTYFAVADCTGHGVPGGMVSLVCSNALNKSLNELKLLNTNEILDSSRDIVVDTFNKNGDEISDGMDIVLCRWEEEKSELQISGANRPLWIFRNGGDLEEIRTDKQPVGKFLNHSPFSNVRINIYKGDNIYMFSDGYVDQFGGNNDSKFKTSQLRSLLLEIKNEDIKRQEVFLVDSFNTWKGKSEQTDDICVWGISLKN